MLNWNRLALLNLRPMGLDPVEPEMNIFTEFQVVLVMSCFAYKFLQAELIQHCLISGGCCIRWKVSLVVKAKNPVMRQCDDY